MKRSNEYEAALLVIPTMPEVDRLQLERHLRSLRAGALEAGEGTEGAGEGTEAPVGDGARSGVDDAIVELVHYLNAAGVLSVQPSQRFLREFKKSPRGKSSVRKFEALWKYMQTYAEDRSARRALLQIAYGMLFEKIQKFSSSVTLTQMANRVDEIPGCLDRAFPGYAKAGLLAIAVKRHASFEQDPNGR